MIQSLAVLDAPSNLGLQPPGPGKAPGVYKLADALRAAGLVSRLHATDAGRVVPPPYSPEKDAKTGIRNAEAIRAFSLKLAEKVQPLIERGHSPLVLGGDCSILLGNMLALRRIGRYGLLFIDGHTDFLTPGISRTGGAAGMDLALVSGRGPEELTDIGGLRPLVRDEDVVVFGYRDVASPERYVARDIFETGMHLYDLDKARRLGVRRAAEEGVAALARNGVAGFWIHLDADVLDDAIMPAVDSRQPGGMSYAELNELLRAVLSSGLAVGMEITIFDPDLDPDGSIAGAFTAAIVQAFEETGWCSGG